MSVGKDLDLLATLGVDGSYVSLPHAIVALGRQSVPASRSLCIVATARNEGIYLLEWIAYHRAIGVERIFLYTNDNDDGSDELLALLAEAQVICWIRNAVERGGNAQQKVYGHAFGANPALLDYRWALVIDIDEYLAFNPDLFRSATALINWYESKGADAVALNWVIHGSGGKARWSDAFIGDRFPSAQHGPGAHIKTLARTNAFIHSTPHFPRRYRNRPFTFCSADGQRHVPLDGADGLAHASRPNDDFAWISHYFFKSAEEFLWKWSRNRGDHATIAGPTTTVLTADFVESFVQQFEAPSRRRPDLRACAPGFGAELSRLMSLPGVAAANAEVARAFRDRIQTIIPMFAEAESIRAAGNSGRALMSMLNASVG